MSGSRYAYCVFCDDVRQEVGNKMSLMGIYGGDLRAQAQRDVPMVLPKLTIVLWIICGLEDDLGDVSVKVTGPPDETPIFVTTIPASPSEAITVREGAKRRLQNVVFELTPFPILEDGVIEVTVVAKGEEMLAGRLHVHIVEPPSAPA